MQELRGNFMNMKMRIILVAIIAALAAACGQQAPTVTERRSSSSQHTTTGSEHGTQPQARVPAYQEAKSASILPATLQPEQFFGPTRDAYRVAKEIPETIAQLPCYCHCDQSIGHKSLHSCFQDTHASQCTVCVSEALMAYNLQKSGMNPTQIRERIISQYSRQE
jgi:Protein of unknown function with PCYCGC motif